MTTTHTPTPWIASGHKIYEADDGIGNLIAVLEVAGFDDAEKIVAYPGDANAAFIVTACNAHDALTARVAELEAALCDLINSIQPPALAAENMTRAPMPKYFNAARAALKGAK